MGPRSGGFQAPGLSEGLKNRRLEAAATTYSPIVPPVTDH